MSTFVADVAALCHELAASPDPDVAATATDLLDRLYGPLRLAIAGRVKAGKSTLLNALVGERMAPTDAGECTRIVTWYLDGPTYDVTVHQRDGGTAPLRFTRGADHLDIDLGGRDLDAIARLEVRWPSATLRSTTLIDTPGLASVDAANSARTEAFLGVDDDRATDADAVIYLVRHVHRRDVDFLEAFMDRSVRHASPVNALAVLSRADEIGGGRLDALDAARRVADRYATDPQLRALVGAVVPVAGLLAETGATLREDEAAAVRTLAALPDHELDDLTVTVDRFVDASRSPLTAETRRDLLGRLGLFGVRFAIDAVRSGRATTATELSAALLEVSGIGALREQVNRSFLPRTRVLQARTAVGRLRELAARLAATDPATADRIASAVDRIEAGADELAELRLLHLLTTGAAHLDDEEADAARHLVLGGDPRARLGLDADAPEDACRTAALDAVRRWRARGADPLSDPDTTEAADLAARAAEGLYAALHQAG